MMIALTEMMTEYNGQFTYSKLCKKTYLEAADKHASCMTGHSIHTMGRTRHVSDWTRWETAHILPDDCLAETPGEIPVQTGL